jgi:uncharacterized protein
MFAPEQLALLLPLVFLVAVAYSSVGHGGASGYLAVLSFFGLAPALMAPSALLLNLLVSGVAFVAFWRAGHFDFRLLWPFLVGSVPMAFVGGVLRVSPQVYMAVLGAVLVFVAWRLLAAPVGSAAGEHFSRPPKLAVAVLAGAGIGLLSGMVGVGGGIFLSPLLILLGWADAKRTAAASAAFIWINSAAGLYGHLTRTAVDWPALAWLVGAAFVGGLVGSRLGARRLPTVWLRRILGVVLLVAAYKLFSSAL